MLDSKITFSEDSMKEFNKITGAVLEVVDISLEAFRNNDIKKAEDVEPLEQVVDYLKDEMMTRHIQRMKDGKCSIEAGIIWTDLLTDLERTSDHGSNVAGCIIDMADHRLNIHETIKKRRRNDPDFEKKYQKYFEEYDLAAV